MERLQFGARARRKARLKRLAMWAFLVSMGAALLGLPGADAGLGFVDGLAGGAVRRSGTVTAGGVQATETAASLLRFRSRSFKTRPTPSPTPAAPEESEPEPEAPAPGGSIAEIVHAAAAEFGLDGGYLLSVAHCESALNPDAYSAAGYHGLFQFDEQTWAAFGYGSIWDPVAQSRTAARLLAAGHSSRWPNCA